MSDVNESVKRTKRCAMCPEIVVYTAPRGLAEGAIVFCSEICERLWDAVTPGEWVDAATLMPGRENDRPEIWEGPDAE
jgi:hypothetical protein